MTLEILAISGSLRRSSSNTTLLRAAALLAPEGVDIILYEGLGDLPAFNPDIEETDLPAVRDFQARLKSASAVLISSPEYAHGVPGSLKNALDWVVGSGELVDKPVALLNASPYSKFAVVSLNETLTVMSAKLISDASVTLSLAGKKLDESGIAEHPEIAPQLKSALATLVSASLSNDTQN